MSVNNLTQSLISTQLVLNSTKKAPAKNYYEGNKEVSKRLEMLKRHQEIQRQKAEDKRNKKKSQTI
jgi:hypothetical protein